MFTKLKNNLPWLVRYPFWRVGELLNRAAFGESGRKHLIFVVANHFEPAWKENGKLDLDAQRRRLDDWHAKARVIGEAVRDSDDTKFRHTNFYPAEQYNKNLLDTMAEMERGGLGEVEIHLHHGVEKPDTAENLRRSLVEFRDALASEHGCLSYFENSDVPRYAFVHGNLALGNSAGGKLCGVENEFRILQETGCYADFTLPTAPDETQVPLINQIYEAAGDFDKSVPHRFGKRLSVGHEITKMPIIFNGALTMNLFGKINNWQMPKLDDSGLTAAQGLDSQRLHRWRNANITVSGQPDWIFIKLYCHGFFDQDQDACIGEPARRFFSEIVEQGAQTGKYQTHFATAREAFNIIAAAVDRRTGSPHDFRDYKLKKLKT